MGTHGARTAQGAGWPYLVCRLLDLCRHALVLDQEPLALERKGFALALDRGQLAFSGPDEPALRLHAALVLDRAVHRILGKLLRPRHPAGIALAVAAHERVLTFPQLACHHVQVLGRERVGSLGRKRRRRRSPVGLDRGLEADAVGAEAAGRGNRPAQVDRTIGALSKRRLRPSATLQDGDEPTDLEGEPLVVARE